MYGLPIAPYFHTPLLPPFVAEPERQAPAPEVNDPPF